MATSTNLGPPRPPTAHVIQWLRQHPQVSFSLLAFSLAWGMELLVLGLWHPPSGGVEDAFRIALPTLLGGPTLPAFLMTALTEGRAGMDRLLHRYVLWRVGWRWYLFVLLGAPFLILLSLLIPPGAITGLREPVPLLVVSYVPALIIIFLVGGPLTEEPGWRGFALPRLEHRLGPLWGTLLLGALWGLWHLPLFLFTPGYNGAGTGLVGIGLPFLAFVLGEVALAVIFTWVFNNARGSLLLTMLLHASANTVMGTVFPTPMGYLSLYSLYIVGAVLLIVATRGRLSYQPDLIETIPAAPVAQQPGTPGTLVDGSPG